MLDRNAEMRHRRAVHRQTSYPAMEPAGMIGGCPYAGGSGDRGRKSSLCPVGWARESHGTAPRRLVEENEDEIRRAWKGHFSR